MMGWWPQPDSIDAIREGELWVDIWMCATICPQETWIDGRPLYATDMLSQEPRSDGKMRWVAYRRVDANWFAYLYHRTLKGMTKLKNEYPNAWPIIASRTNDLTSMAKRWWGEAKCQSIVQYYALDARYRPPHLPK